MDGEKNVVNDEHKGVWNTRREKEVVGGENSKKEKKRSRPWGGVYKLERGAISGLG